MPPQDAELRSLLAKGLTGFIALCTAVAIGLGTFALKETVSAQLAIRELNVRMLSVEASIESAQSQQRVLSEGLYATKLSDQRLSRVESDMAELKNDIKTLLRQSSNEQKKP